MVCGDFFILWDISDVLMALVVINRVLGGRDMVQIAMVISLGGFGFGLVPKFLKLMLGQFTGGDFHLWRWVTNVVGFWICCGVDSMKVCCWLVTIAFY